LGWGVAGSALATILGQACSCASVLWYFIFTPNVPIRLRGRYMALRMSLVKQILSLGVASFILQAGMAVVNFVLNNLLNIYGSQSVYGAEGALASIGIVQRVAMFVVMPLIGMSVAAQPLLGYCYGARNFARVRKAFFCAEVGAISLGVIGWIIIRLFAHPIVGFFGVTDPSLADFTASAMKIQLLVLPLAGFQIVGSNYFQATGQPVKSIFLTLTRQIIFLIPLYIVLPQVLPVMFPQYTGLDALYFSVPLSDTLSCIAVALFIIREMRKLRRKEAQQAA
jgi:Na+-driven multidrug efflux pump